MSTVLTTEKLQDISGYTQGDKIREWLKSQNIRFLESRNGPWTTQEGINAAMGLTTNIDIKTINQEDDLL